jgi:phytoene dehydrogenase-like protein
MRAVLVVGGGLPGLAAALRLAKAGHPVQLWDAGDRVGGRYAAHTLAGELLVDAAPAVIGFPAPWRDLFRKSGRILEAELARSGVALQPAGPARYQFADGTELVLPTERGEQHAALSTAYGARTAGVWRNLLDWLDEVWQAIRRLGLEAELTDPSQLSSPVRRLLRPRLSVAGLAEQTAHPVLAGLVRESAIRLGSAPARTPAWAAVTLSVERRFGRWTVTAPTPDPQARTGRTSTLIDALVARLAVRKVDVRLAHQVTGIASQGGELVVNTAGGTEGRFPAVIFTGDPWQLPSVLPRSTLRRTRRDLRRLEPALTPLVTHRLIDESTERVSETVRLSADGVPVVTYRRPVVGGSLVSVHDYTAARPDPSAGVAWHGFRSWFRRPPVTTEVSGLFFAGPHTAAGSGLSATLLAGALASYGAHDRG